MDEVERDINEINWPKVVLFGDSLTQRSFEPEHGLWGTLLADKLQRIADVVVRGFSGYNSTMCKIILPRLFNTKSIKDVKAFVILLGSNDSSSSHDSRKSHVPVDEYVDNLIYMVDYLVSIGLQKKSIILMTPPPYFHENFVSFCDKVGWAYPEKDNEITGKYAKACSSIASKCNVDCCDLYTEMMKDENWSNYLIDGLHFSNSGSRKLFSLLHPLIEKRLDVSKTILPLWREVDPLNPVPYLTKYCTAEL